MKKKIVAISIVLVGTALAAMAFLGFFEPENILVDQPGGPQLGVRTEFVIDTELPEAPETMPYYKVVYEDYDRYFHELLRGGRQWPQNLPSEEEAARIAEEYIESHGGMPDDAVFGGVSTNYWYHMRRGGEVIEKKADRVQVGYHRAFNGMPVAGPGDTIHIEIGDNGTVLSFLKSWRELEYAGEKEILTASEAVERLEGGKTVRKYLGALETIEIRDIKLGYYSEVPDTEQDFYEPVWIFYGVSSYGYNVTRPVWAGVVPPTPTPVTITPKPSSDDVPIEVPVTVNAPESVSGAFAATINIEDVDDLNSGQLDISFDSSVVNVTDVKGGSIDGTKVPIDDWRFMDADTIRVLFKLPGNDGASGYGYVAKIDFETTGSPAEISVLDISDGLLVGTGAEEIPATWTDGEVVIGVPVAVNASESVSGTFDVTIDVENVVDMNSGQFDLSFDSRVVNVTGVNAGNIGGTTVPIFD